MGEWTVLRYWNPSGDGFHDWHALDDVSTTDVVTEYKCWPVVKEHQAPAKPDAPEFDIEIKYVRLGLAKEGWRYHLTWGSSGYQADYGYDTREEAKRAAESEARGIAMDQLPAEKYKFTPEV